MTDETKPTPEILVDIPKHNPDPLTWRRVPETTLDAEGRVVMTGKMLTLDEAGTIVPLM